VDRACVFQRTSLSSRYGGFKSEAGLNDHTGDLDVQGAICSPTDLHQANHKIGGWNKLSNQTSTSTAKDDSTDATICPSSLVGQEKLDHDNYRVNTPFLFNFMFTLKE